MRVYLLGVGGTGVGSLAGLLKQQGHDVSGADENVYPPMSDKLQEWGISYFEGYDVAHLDQVRPDLVIVGNVIRATNPEAIAVLERGMAHMSMPEAVGEYGIAHRRSLVFAGTHGKTTMTALASHVLMHAQKDPSFLVGGALVGYADSFRSGQGGVFAIEGDEYDTAFFDKGPKFWHYRPHTAVISSLEFDHADIFDSVEDIDNAFRGLIERVPSDGHVLIWQGAERALAVARDVGCKPLIYDHLNNPKADAYLDECTSGPEGLIMRPVFRGEKLEVMKLPLWGPGSAQNAMAVLSSLLLHGLSPTQVSSGFACFQGVKRRLEVINKSDRVVLVDDFAHHPTAVAVTLDAARTRWPNRRIVAAFEPRSATTRRNVFQDAFLESFSKADVVAVGSHERLSEIDSGERFDPARLARDLVARGVDAFSETSTEILGQRLLETIRADDVVMVLSNGAFGGLHAQLREAIDSRSWQ